jgi:outer membrane receptor protein involved in Fe transport
MPEGDSTGDLTGKSLVDVPVNKVTAGFTWTNRILSVNLLYKYVGPRWINDMNTVDLLIGSAEFPGYQTVGFRIWHTFFKKMTVALDVDNLFDVRYVDSRYQQSPGRMIMAEISLNI